VEAVEYFMFPLLASFFKVLPLLLPQKFNRLSRFRFHIPAPCFMKNAFVSGSSKSKMVPSSLPLPASFFKVLLLAQKFNRFYRFQLPLPHRCIAYKNSRSSVLL